MASIKKIVRDNPLSNFRQGVATSAGTGFALLAEAANAAYDRVLPAATKEMEGLFTDEMRAFARGQMGDPSGAVTMSGMADGFDFSPYVTEGGARPDAISGLDGNFRGGLGAMLAAAPEGIRGQLKIGSGYRSEGRQAELWAEALKKYGSPEAARKWVAPPGKSKHNAGQAADVKFGSDAAREWAHANAAQFGMHFPLGNEPWHIEPLGSRGGTTTTSTQNVMIRDKDGALQPRLFSPTAGPLLQVANAAAGVAYQSEVLLQGGSDIMEMSRQFELNPDGFRQAADGYVSDMVAKAPAMFREDVRSSLTKEAQRRFLGMVEEKHRDTMQRANNSSAALVDRWSDNLAEAYAGGNQEEIDDARSQLDGLLSARESLPGIAWTPENSENTRIDARKKADAITTKRQTEQTRAWKADLSLIGESAMEDLTAAQEGLLSNPLVRQLLPDEWLNAATAVQMRESLPDIFALPPKAIAAQLAAAKTQPVTHESELAMLKTVEATQKQMATDYNKNAIEAAQKYLPDQESVDPQNPDVIRPAKPAPLVLDPTDPAFADSLATRAYDAKQLFDLGYTNRLTMLGTEDVAAFNAMFAKGVPGVARLEVAKTILDSLEPDAAAALFSQINGMDNTTRRAAELLTAGAQEPLAEKIMMGQDMIDSGQAVMLSDANLSAAMSEVAGLVPNAKRLGVMAAARAIYAVDVGGKAQAAAESGSSDELTALAKEAVQQALGKFTDESGRTVGGIREVGYNTLLLPPDVAGDELDSALELGVDLGTDLDAFWKRAGMMSQPMVGDRPLSSREAGYVSMRHIEGGTYRLQIVSPSGAEIDLLTVTGAGFDFDIHALTDAANGG